MESNKTENIYKALRLLINTDKHELEKMGACAYQTFLKHFYIDNTSDKFIEKMQEIAS
jgi:hypothetical protein